MTVQDGTQKSQKVFVNIPTEVGATEAEEIGASISNGSAHASRPAAKSVLSAICPRIQSHAHFKKLCAASMHGVPSMWDS
jgi:hypothetical protein